MLSFNSLYQEAQEQAQDDSATTLTLLKRAINQGAKKFGAVLNREWRTSYKAFSLVANQQFYKTPVDSIRPKSVTVTIANISYFLVLIEDDETWRHLNYTVQRSSIPEFFYIKGNNQFGIYPIPSGNVSNAGEIAYERRMRDMSVDDYTTGTIAVTGASTAVVGSGTTFTALMIGRSVKINDANGDGMWYKISAHTSATSITLDQPYEGTTASGLSFAIGELPDIPEEFHESIIDYALFRFYTRRKDVNMAGTFKGLYEESLKSCKETYSSKTSSQYYRQPNINSRTFQNINSTRQVS